MASELERTIDNIVGDTVSSKLDSFAVDLAQRLQSECAELVDQVRKLDAPRPDRSVEKLLEGLRQIQNGDLSSAFAELMDLHAEDRVGLFPVRLRTKVLAILYCDSKGLDGAQTAMQSAPIEALISAAEGWIEAVSTRKR